MKTSGKKTVVPVITGPTASGKTALAHALAKKNGAAIVSADSRQIYRGMDIGTAKPSSRLLGEVSYHFIGEKEPEEEYSAGDYARDAVERIRSLHERGTRVVVAGGSTLYVQGLLHGFAELPPKSPEIRRRLAEELRKSGADSLYERLKALDPEQARTLDPTKTQRLVRSLEIIAVSGKTVTELQASGSKRPGTFDWLPLGLRMPREELYRRIDRRTDEMMAEGLLEEARTLFDRYAREGGNRTNALETVGYKELFSHFRGEIDLDTAVELIARHTRNYAKRQLTFFRNRLDIEWVDAPPDEEAFRQLVEALANRCMKP